MLKRLDDTSRETTVRRTRAVVVFVFLVIGLVVFFVLSLCMGSVSVPLDRLGDVLFGVDTGGIEYQVVWSIRLPRIIAAILLGGALALSGFLLQTFFNNPIAGPFILGISSGAKLAVALVMIVVVGSAQAMDSWMLVASAFVGSMVAMFFVLLVSKRIQSMAMLIVAGVMIGYICSAATDFLITFASDQNIVNLKNWSLGSFSGVNWNDIGIMTVVVLVCSALTFLLSKPIGAFQMGEQYAQSMGVNIRLFRFALIVLSSMLAACVTAFAGPISFVGIAVPHLVKRFLATSKPIVVVPAAFLGGGIFCMFCDLLARSMFAPTEVSISAVTAIFGAPIVIGILLRRQKAKHV
jgi:iron complex transport system permease protein